MSAGYIQLAAIGQQDAYLTGSPQITYFSGVYKRHTPFVLEAYEIPFNQQKLTYGSTAICRIPPKGDLVRALTLKLDLPPLFDPGNDWTWPLAPSIQNDPAIWLKLPNGTTTAKITATIQVPYYSTSFSSYSLWAPTFAPYLSYRNGKFSFTGVSSVIVQNIQNFESAASCVFWGFDPINATTDVYGNLVFTSTTGVVTPTLTLEQSGWIQTRGSPVITKTGLYLNLNQNLPLSGLQFLNFSQLGTYGALWSITGLTTDFAVSPGGCIQFYSPGYYTISLGFNLGVGSIFTVSYGTSGLDGEPFSPTFQYTYTYTVSPDPSSPTVIPIVISVPNSYYYFYVATTGIQALTGTWATISFASELYSLSNFIVNPTNSCVPLYGNVAPVSSTSLTLAADSSFSFASAGEYLISGVISVSNTATEQYVANVSIGQGGTALYTYDMTLQARNPTYTFSLPLVASTSTQYYINVVTTQTLANLALGSYWTVSKIGAGVSDLQSNVVQDNGALFLPSSSILTTPLNLKTKFNNYSNTSYFSVQNDGSIKFSAPVSYMLTSVINVSNTFPTSITVSNSSINYTQSFNFSLGISPSYTISVPFTIVDTTALYTVSVVMAGPNANVLDGTYIAVYPITSNITGSLGASYSYYDSVGTAAILTADLKIGGQTVQRLTGEYIELWNELNIPYENQPGLQLLTGKYDTHTNIPPPGRTYYVNLPFYFFGENSLSLPMVALERQDVEVWVSFNNFSNLTAVSITSPTLAATIITEYVYLANPEIDWFKTHQLDYVILQCQYEQFSIPSGLQTAIYELKFKNPVKELFFVVQPSGNLPYDYSQNGLASLGLTFNGQDAFLTRTTDATYVGAIEPLKHHVNFFSKAPGSSVYGRQFYMYVFSTNPLGHKSSGAINFSRIRQVLLELNMYNAQGYYPAKDFRIMATSQNVLRIENGIAGVMFS
jgi:hypothetical protein